MFPTDLNLRLSASRLPGFRAFEHVVAAEHGAAAVAEPPSAVEAEVEIAQPRAAKPKRKSKPKRQPRYNVILWDDDDHTYDYVIELCITLFHKTPADGLLAATEVDLTGRVILLTTTKEHAELKQDQVHAYGRDLRMSQCKGSMTCSIEPAPGE